MGRSPVAAEAGESRSKRREKGSSQKSGRGRQQGETFGADAFRPVEKRETVSHSVLGQIIALLRSGELKPGDRLPTERELAARLGIGRPSLREALSALNLVGILEQRQGRGTFLVTSLDRLPLEPYLYQLLLNEGTFDELIEVRQLLEPGIAAIAAKRATDDAREEIRRLLELYEQEVEHGTEIDAEALAGAEFHQALARATGNQTLARLVESLRDLLSATGHVLGEHERGGSLEAHRALVKAVMERNAAEAERVMRKHLKDVASRLRASRS